MYEGSIESYEAVPHFNKCVMCVCVCPFYYYFNKLDFRCLYLAQTIQ